MRELLRSLLLLVVVEAVVVVVLPITPSSTLSSLSRHNISAVVVRMSPRISGMRFKKTNRHKENMMSVLLIKKSYANEQHSYTLKREQQIIKIHLVS